MMKDRGCAFKVVEDGAVRYYTSAEVSGLSGFARFLHENERDGGGCPLPLAGRIPGAVEVSEAAWLAMADDPEAEGRFACFLIVDIVGNVLWVNEDRGDGLAHYLFPLTAVLEMAAGAGDIWPALMARFPNARIGRVMLWADFHWGWFALRGAWLQIWKRILGLPRLWRLPLTAMYRAIGAMCRRRIGRLMTGRWNAAGSVSLPLTYGRGMAG